MNISINREAFLKQLGRIVHLSQRSVIMPVLTNVHLKFRASENEAMLTATDLQTSMVTSLDCLPTEDMTILLPGRNLWDIARSLDGKEFTLDVEAEGNTATIRQGKAKFKLVRENPEEYPEIQKVEGETFTIEAGDLQDLMEKVEYAISRSEEQYVYMNLMLKAKGGELFAVATDRFRLVMRKAVVEGIPEFPPTLVPLRAVEDLLKSKTLEGKVEVTRADRQIMFVMPDLTLATRLTEGTFPDYEQVVPHNTDHVTVDRLGLLRAVRRISTVDPKSERLKVVFEANQITLELEGKSGEATDILDCQRELSETKELHFNPRYLSEMLQNLSGESVTLELPEGYGACMAKEENYLAIIMPVRA